MTCLPNSTAVRMVPRLSRISLLSIVLGSLLVAMFLTFSPSASQEASASIAKPGPSNTGVPRGTKLRVHYGDLTIRTPGTVIDGMDIRGYVRIRADNVTIKRSIIRGGGRTDGEYRALIMSWWGAKGLQVTDTSLISDGRSLRTDGLSGGQFIATRVQISGVVDAIKVIGDNVYIQRSWLRNTVHSKRDPYTRDGVTHDDGVQITGGWNVHIRDNTLEGSKNAAIMISTQTYRTGNLHIKSNWISGGACAINVTQANRGPVQRSFIYKNRFSPGLYGKTCAMRIPRNADIVRWENRFNDGSRPSLVSF